MKQATGATRITTAIRAANDEGRAALIPFATAGYPDADTSYEVAVAMIASRGGNLRAVQTVPWYTLSAGLVGLIIVGTISYTVPRLGLSKAFTIIVASQFLVASILDHYGLIGAAVRPMDLSRLVGMALLVVGVWLSVR